MTRYERYIADVERQAAEVHAANNRDPLRVDIYRAAVMDNRIRDLLAAIEREHPDSIILKQIDGWLDWCEKEQAA